MGDGGVAVVRSCSSHGIVTTTKAVVVFLRSRFRTMLTFCACFEFSYFLPPFWSGVKKFYCFWCGCSAMAYGSIHPPHLVRRGADGRRRRRKSPNISVICPVVRRRRRALTRTYRKGRSCGKYGERSSSKNCLESRNRRQPNRRGFVLPCTSIPGKHRQRQRQGQRGGRKQLICERRKEAAEEEEEGWMGREGVRRGGAAPARYSFPAMIFCTRKKPA